MAAVMALLAALTALNPAQGPRINDQATSSSGAPGAQLVAAQAECPPGCTEVPTGPTVHGDPMFKLNGTGTHFSIAPGELTVLMRWSSASGAPDQKLSSMQLSGRTAMQPETDHQWFVQLVITKDEVEVLDVDTSSGIEVITAYGGEIEQVGTVRRLSSALPCRALTSRHSLAPPCTAYASLPYWPLLPTLAPVFSAPAVQVRPRYERFLEVRGPRKRPS